jgi:protein-S-isoprenylcysteine O-methyltransferase Ste14
MYLLRHALAVLPIWIARRSGVLLTLPATPVDAAAAVIGCALGIVGLTLFAASLRQFFSHGRGTLAPWDPPRRLVIEGPYRYVRNPMISGVVFVLFGVSAMLRSGPHAAWALAFLAANGVWIPLVEEPMLEQRFGRDYARYREHVRRLLPRLSPWNPGESGGGRLL